MCGATVDSVCSEDGWCRQNPIPEGSGPPSLTVTLWANFENDVWIVGDTTALHWNGTSWIAYPADFETSPHSIWAGGANDLWVALDSGVFQWDGETWTRHAIAFASHVWGDSNGGVWVATPHGIHSFDGMEWSRSYECSERLCYWLTLTGTSSNDVWALRSQLVEGDDTLFRWDGQTWASVPVPEAENPPASLWVGEGEVWAAGDSGFRWDGSGWQTVDAGSGWFMKVWGTGADDIWLFGETTRHYDGAAWRTVATPGDEPFAQVAGLTGRLVGWSEAGLFVRDGEGWAQVDGGATHEYLLGVWGAAADDLWAVGGDAAIVRFDGQRWRSVASPVDVDWYDVHGTSASDVWIVGGRSGTSAILHWDGQALTSLQTPPNTLLNDVLALSPTDAWAVGSARPASAIQPLALRWNGTEWIDHSPPGTNLRLSTVAGIGSEVWATGWISTTLEDLILRWDGTAWSNVELPPTIALGALWGTAPDDVWATGAASPYDVALWHWDGATWSAPTLFYGEHMTDICAGSPNDLWAVGDGAYHFDGTSWRERLGAFGLSACVVVPDAGLWVVGERGLIEHRNP